MLILEHLKLHDELCRHWRFELILSRLFKDYLVSYCCVAVHIKDWNCVHVVYGDIAEL